METAVKYQVNEINWPEKKFFTQRARLGFDKLKDFFSQSYGAIYGQLGKMGIQPTEMPCAIYYSLDEKKQETDMAAAVPVKTDVPDIKGFERVTIPASKVLTVTHIGPYETMMPAYEALDSYVAEHRLTKSLVIEEYFSDPSVEKDPNKWKTNIYFVIT